MLDVRTGSMLRQDALVGNDGELRKLAHRLCGVDGVVGVLLGGSGARGEHMPKYDLDLGLKYQPRLDIEGLQDLARDVAALKAKVTRSGQ